MTLPLELGAVQDANVRRAFEQIAQQYPLGPAGALGAAPSTVATLPTGTQNGQDFYYRISGGGVWHFKYDPTSAKWDFAGGPPMFAEVTTATTTTSVTFANPASGSGPSITVPFAGDYEVMIGALIFQTGGGTGVMSYDIGGTGAVDADSIQDGSATTPENGARARVKTGLAANTALTAKYRTTAGTVNIQDRWMRVTPVRIG